MSNAKKKNSRLIGIIAAIAALVVLVVIYFVVSALNKPEPVIRPAATGDLMIAEYDASKIKGLSYTWNGETVDLTYSDILYKWQLTDEKNFPVLFDIPGAMASAISQIKANRVVEESTEHFADYGLDKPYISVTATYEDTAVSYIMGNYNSQLDGWYFNIVGSDTVYLIPSGLNPFFEYTKLELADVDVIPLLSDSSVTELTMSYAGEQLDEEKTAAITDALVKLYYGGMKTVGFISSEADVAKYGFDSGVTIDIKYKEAQNLENADSSGETSSYTSTVYIDKSLEYTFSQVNEADGTAYFTCGSGLVYAVDPEITAAVIAALG